MTDYDFDAKLAYSIVERTMKIIDCNINVMDARGRIIGSGDRERIGEIQSLYTRLCNCLLLICSIQHQNLKQALTRGQGEKPQHVT